MTSVALLREPFGLPELPIANLPAVFLPFFMCYDITHHQADVVKKMAKNFGLITLIER